MPEIRKQATQSREVERDAVEPAGERRELVCTRPVVAVRPRDLADPALQPQLLALERERMRVAVGQRALDPLEVEPGTDRHAELADKRIREAMTRADGGVGSHAGVILRRGEPTGKGRVAHSPRESDPASPGHNAHAVRPRWIIVLLAAAAVSPTEAVARPAPLPTRLADALAIAGIPTTGAAVVDLATGQTLFSRNAGLPLEPASNEKLLVTYAALTELGPTYRFRTQVIGLGQLSGATWAGSIVLKGYGDPTLSSADLRAFAARLRGLGIRRVSGGVIGDESWFDASRTAPGWKRSFTINESPPLSALVVDRARYDHHIALHPALAAAGAFRRALRSEGIAVSGPATTGASHGGDVLVLHASRPLERILAFMDQESDNFTAELLLKELGAEAGDGGTTAAGASVVTGDLLDAGIPMLGVRIVDGSGLSAYDRLTANAVVSLLKLMWDAPELRSPLWQALPIAGVNGTLEHRMRRRPARGGVRAKTGTTDEASALSGFAAGRFAFALLENGSPVPQPSARRSENAFATVLADAAHGG